MNEQEFQEPLPANFTARIVQVSLVVDDMKSKQGFTIVLSLSESD
jgi:hypothetical protein